MGTLLALIGVAILLLVSVVVFVCTEWGSLAIAGAIIIAIVYIICKTIERIKDK